MKNLVKLGLVAAAIVALALWLSRKNKPQVFNGPATITTPGNVVVVHQSGKPDTHIYQPQPSSTVVTTDTHGNVTVYVKQFGAGFDPGIGIVYADKLRLSLDSRLLFYKRFGLNAGLAFALNRTDGSLGDIVKPFVAVSYAVPFTKFSNTSLLLGVTIDKRVVGGVRLKF